MGKRTASAVYSIPAKRSCFIVTAAYSISKSKRTRRRAADSAHARQGEADKVIFDLEMELDNYSMREVSVMWDIIFALGQVLCIFGLICEAVLCFIHGENRRPSTVVAHSL